MSAFVNTLLLVYAALFPVVNPVGSAPLFLGVTEGCAGNERRTLARQVSVNSFFLLLGSLFIGSHVLGFFGVSLPVVRVAGGLVVTAFGWKLLNAEPSPDAKHAAESARGAAPESFYPLTMPLTVGPGSISIAITLGSQRPRTVSLEHLATLGAAAVAGIVLIVISVYLCYRFAQRLVSMLGHGGTSVVVRLSAFIMVCIGIHILWSGWSDLNGIPH
ncbi:MAG: MarC family protein [Caulobacteraceae bacterium]